MSKDQVVVPVVEGLVKDFLILTARDYRVKPQWGENPKPTNLKKKKRKHITAQIEN